MAPNQPSDSPDSSASFCIACGEPLDNNAFCHKCGSPVYKPDPSSPSSAQVVCWQCYKRTPLPTCIHCEASVQPKIEETDARKVLRIVHPSAGVVDISLDDLTAIVEEGFAVVFSNFQNVPLYVIEDNLSSNEFKKNFSTLLAKARAISPGLTPLSTRITFEGKPFIRIFFGFTAPPQPNKYGLALFLFIATIFTVSWAGYISATLLIDTEVVLSNGKFLGLEKRGLSLAFQFSFSLISIILFHEMGHFFMARRRKMETSFPYFIPAPGIGLGTFGALIRQKELASSRDNLFDVGIAGPIAGFIPSIIFSIIGIFLTYFPNDDVLATFNEENSLSLFGDMIPPLFLIIAYIIGIFDPNISSAFLDDLSQAPILHPIALAGFIGLFITGINLMPAGQLDGGHISRATFGRKHHRYISYFAIMIMLFLDLWLFALLVFFTMPRKETPIALNDVSELSSSRRVLGAVFFFIGILCLPWPTYILEYII